MIYTSEDRRRAEEATSEPINDQPVPVPENQRYYNVNPTSALYTFLRENNVSSPVQFIDILTKLKLYILINKCFDPANTSIILCSQLLENIFGMKSLHVIQIKAALLKHLSQVPPPPAPVPNHHAADRLKVQQGLGSSIATSSAGSARRPKPTMLNDNRLFRYSAQFVATVLPPGSDPNQVVCFRQAAEAISRYILSRKMHIIDNRNILIAMVKDDPLGQLFGVQAFHRSQTKHFLQKHLIPVSEDATAAAHVEDALPGAHQDTAVTSRKGCSEAAIKRGPDDAIKRNSDEAVKRCSDEVLNLSLSKQARMEII